MIPKASTRETRSTISIYTVQAKTCTDITRINLVQHLHKERKLLTGLSSFSLPTQIYMKQEREYPEYKSIACHLIDVRCLVTVSCDLHEPSAPTYPTENIDR